MPNDETHGNTKWCFGRRRAVTPWKSQDQGITFISRSQIGTCDARINSSQHQGRVLLQEDANRPFPNALSVYGRVNGY
jgi:hypothetical protein